MTTNDLTHLEKTVTESLTKIYRDEVWKKAFDEYNKDAAYHKEKKKIVPYLGGQPLKLDCKPCYSIVLRYLKSKYKI